MFALTRHVSHVGSRFGRLTIAGLRVEYKRVTAICACDCGEACETSLYDILKGRTQSCGCLQRERARAAHLKHGDAPAGRPAVEYVIWCSMLDRCRNPQNRQFKNYGGRGIHVCQRWHSYANFRADMGRRPTPTHSLDRFPDNNGNYEPGNARWATPSEQAQNKRTTRLITAFGRTQALSAWALDVQRDRRLIARRLDDGWTPERALMEAPRWQR